MGGPGRASTDLHAGTSVTASASCWPRSRPQRHRLISVAWSRICLPPTPFARLEGACGKLEATSGSVLTIADVLEALRKQEQLWEQRLVVEEARRDGRIAAWGEKIITALTENGPSSKSRSCLAPTAPSAAVRIDQEAPLGRIKNLRGGLTGGRG